MARPFTSFSPPAVAVITAVPGEMAVTVPFSSTEAILLFEDVQLTSLFVAFCGATTTDKVTVLPTVSVFPEGVTVTDVTGTLTDFVLNSNTTVFVLAFAAEDPTPLSIPDSKTILYVFPASSVPAGTLRFISTPRVIPFPELLTPVA